MTDALDHFPPNRTAAIERLHRFVPLAGRDYAARRNYDLGAGAHNGVSTLSPYLRTRIITEAEVLQAVLGRYSLGSAEKFVQEVFWRTYWKGWLEMRPGIWADYKAQVARDLDAVQTQGGLRQDWEAACLGRTGIACFDAWAEELVQTGYLHNHSRMWFASIWIFTLKLPWALGADFFLRHLLDGDPASNTLSWRWVGGMQTRGKTYLARPDNIAKYTEGRFRPDGLAREAMPLPAPEPPARMPLPHFSPPQSDLRSGFLLHADDLSPGFALPASGPAIPTAVLRAETALSPLQIAPHLSKFTDGVIADTTQRYADKMSVQITATQAAAVKTWAAENKLEQLVTPYAPVGPVADLIDEITRHNDIPVVQVRRAYDSAAWPHATHGFFRFKEKIPHLVAQIKGLAPA